MCAVWLQSLAPWLQHPAGGQPVAQRTMKGTGGRWGREVTTSKVLSSLMLFSHSVIYNSLRPHRLQCAVFSVPHYLPEFAQSFLDDWHHSIVHRSSNPQPFLRLTPGTLVLVRAPHTPHRWERKGHPFRPIAQALPLFLDWMAGAVAGDDLCPAALMDVDLLVLSFGLCLSLLPLKTWLVQVRHTQAFHTHATSPGLGLELGWEVVAERTQRAENVPPQRQSL